MKAPNKFIKFIEEGRNADEVIDWIIKASGEPMDIREIHIVDKPIGEHQGDHEYCYQVEHGSESGVYAYSGTYYHKFENSDKWLAYDYYTLA